MASSKIICSFIFVQMLLIIINTEGTEIYLQREKEEKRFILQREKEEKRFFKHREHRKHRYYFIIYELSLFTGRQESSLLN